MRSRAKAIARSIINHSDEGARSQLHHSAVSLQMQTQHLHLLQTALTLYFNLFNSQQRERQSIFSSYIQIFEVQVACGALVQK